MEYKYRVYFILEKEASNKPITQWMEFDSHYIDSGVVRNFDGHADIDIFSIRTVFDHISDAKIMSVDLNFLDAGCNLHTTGWLDRYKDSKNRSVMIVELGTNDDSKDTLFAWKWLGAGVKDIMLTHQGAITVFDFTDKGESQAF